MRVKIIAEIGQAHDGSLGILHSLIDEASKAGVDFIKFQTHIAEAESSEFESFRIKFSYEDDSRFDYWKRMQFTKEQWVGIKKHCENCDVEFVSSSFSNAAVDLLEALGVKRYKIGSGEVNNLLLIDKIARTGKELWLSSGMSSYMELDKTVNYIKDKGNKLAIFQCTTQYPTTPREIGLNVLKELKERYDLPVGLSDHSGKIYPAIAAATLGIEYVEVHVTFDKGMFGPDSSSSLTISELSQLVEGIRFIEESIEYPVDKTDNSNFDDLRKTFGKSLAVNKDLNKNHMLIFEDLESKKPTGYGIPSMKFQSVIGKKLNKNKKAFEFLTESDLSDE